MCVSAEIAGGTMMEMQPSWGVLARLYSCTGVCVCVCARVCVCVVACLYRCVYMCGCSCVHLCVMPQHFITELLSAQAN